MGVLQPGWREGVGKTLSLYSTFTFSIVLLCGVIIQALALTLELLVYVYIVCVYVFGSCHKLCVCVCVYVFGSCHKLLECKQHRKDGVCVCVRSSHLT